MDNNRLNELRSDWLEDADESAITDLLIEVMRVAHSESRRYVGHCDAQEIASSVAHYVFSRLTDMRNWDYEISAMATKLAKRRVRELNKYSKTKERYEEYVMIIRKQASEARRGQFRDLVVDSLTSREWSIVHGVYWKNERPSQLAKRVALTKRRVNQIRAEALEQLRITLRSIGINRSNYRKWYYEL